MHYRITTKIPLRHSGRTFRPPNLDHEIPLIYWEPREKDDEEAGGKTGNAKGAPATRLPDDDLMKAIPEGERAAKAIGQLYRVFQDVSTKHATKENFRSNLDRLREERRIIQTKDGRFYRPE
jgi:hypothetical protein